MKRTKLTKRDKRNVNPGGPFILTFVQGNNWSGNVPVSSTSGTSSSSAVTANGDLVVVTSESLSTAANGVAIITLTNAKIVAGTTVRCSLVDYATGAFSTNGLPFAVADAINTSAHTVVINICNPGTNALSGVVKVLVEVVTLPA